ncbi:putative uncharacterized protein DDB_G0277255 isoform X2 [Sitodiplosis mosellana]|uniref:putative uncharacterized protein DDB_G0277255 isoform X2 n=1 Tax=Sitodiplosis mosellana TaxID=263140 RepID=UPI00244526B7|nr:putative uncharacterized protein DDB_G0277255 isoform X2 [Sitodiplosis mosellana]XP_055311510.1 putative uncharacterized protein DDB_G0277255 isoform X2 [Sitodiplosis mosellana]
MKKRNLDLDDNLNLDDNELKNLLDEAFTYKGPKDKENKSELFKELLHNAELEDQQKDTFYSSHHFRGNSRRPHTSGSLQDLVNEQLLDSDYMLGPQSRRHQQNSRYTKNSSSVSSRQREGGSLPNNVNSSSYYPVSSFSLSKYHKANAKSNTKTKLEAHDYERSATNHHRTGEKVSYCDEIQKSVASTSASVINANDKKHTIINIEDPEEARHLLAHDSLAQDTSEKHRDEGTELVQLKKHRLATMNYLTTVKDHGEAARQNCHVDAPIHFLKYSSPTISTKSPIDPKYVPNRHVHLTPPQVAPNKLDENGNAILPKPTTIPLTTNPSKPPKTKRSNKADRNTTTWTVPQDSDYNIDSIVAFIENKEISKKTNIINVNKNNLSATERNRKEKKNLGNNKKEMNRLKKSTSMEELKSSSKIEEEIAQSERAQVSLRQKQMQNAQKRSTTSDNSKPPPPQQNNNNNNKRGERRSWGTEELNDFEATEDRDAKKHKENKPNTKNNKKSEQLTLTNASIESIPTNVEAAEFHVVTKKKKTKKRQILEEAKAKQQQMSQRDPAQSHGRNSNSNTMSGGNKYQPSSTYTNDRDIYVNSLMTKENRRKSTSSVPPSDKSDSSDLDSVHSLPIESTVTCTSSSIISYAEMARKANQPPEKLSNVNAWPSVSQNGKNSESPENSNISTSSSTVSSRSHASNKSYDTIKTSSPSEEKSSSNLDDSRMMETPKLGEYVKNQLQKSKSCDSEKYTTTMSMDQFPGLEKTVKPQKSHPNFASVLTSPPPLPTSTLSTPAAVPVPTAAPVFPAVAATTTTTANEKPVKGPTAKKSPTPTEANVIQKENAIKAQKHVEEKVDNKIIVDANCSKLQFVQNSAKAEEIANSDSCNLFAPINMKKAKKSQPNVITAQRTARQTAVIFSDRETNHENVSPLLFGDFNDDILQLMKQEENHVGSDTPNGPISITDSSASNCTNAFESAVNHAIYDCNQSKPNILTPMMSSQSDPGYASAHRTTVPTESHEVVDNHQIHTENHVVGNSTITELSIRKSNVTKKTTLNKINVNNNKISDVVSNQSLNNNNNTINNNVSLGDATAKVVSVSQSISDSDSLNNNINIELNDKNRNHGTDGDVMKAQQQQKLQQQQQQQQQQPQHHHNDAGITKPFNAQNNVHNTVSKTGNQSASNYQQQKVIITHDSINKSIDNISNGSKMIPMLNKLSATENEVVPVNSHPANVPQKSASFAETRVPFVTHNHNDIVHFVGSAWEEVKYGRAHYFSGQ